jgi:hypothetical protein
MERSLVTIWVEGKTAVGIFGLLLRNKAGFGIAAPTRSVKLRVSPRPPKTRHSRYRYTHHLRYRCTHPINPRFGIATPTCGQSWKNVS